ncbi:hypothetical protein L2E82_20747 [Cichorium intybus]|uniref:Uncharacterized protein n=1 Tax=Cichorium intybus TaxID=13427 RepID=A0ACB9DU96_CICIN|nr:hypothetical protein L2E82_20747 [Cichorium intybus]
MYCQATPTCDLHDCFQYFSLAICPQAPTKSSYAITIRDYLLPTPSDIKSPLFSLCKNFFDPLDSGNRKIKVYAYHPSSNTCSINYPRMQNLHSEHPMGSLL